MSEKQEIEQHFSEKVIASKLSIKIGKFSIEAEGASAVAITNLFPEYVPKLIEIMEAKNSHEGWKIFRSYLDLLLSDTPTTPTSGGAVATDAKVPGNNNIPGNGGGAA